jgi:hypothetical protein
MPYVLFYGVITQTSRMISALMYNSGAVERAQVVYLQPRHTLIGSFAGREGVAGEGGRHESERVVGRCELRAEALAEARQRHLEHLGERDLGVDVVAERDGGRRQLGRNGRRI